MTARPCTWPGPLADVAPDDLTLLDDLIAELPGRGGADASAKNKTNTRITVAAFARWLAARGTGLFDATHIDCSEWKTARKSLVAPATGVRNWGELNAFYRAAERDHVADPLGGRRSPMARIARPAAPKYVRTKAARLEEYERLLDAFDRRTLIGLRDACICSLMFRSGLRVGELAQLDLLDVDFDARRILVEDTKSDEPRRPPLHPDTVALLRRYLRRRGDHAGALFVNTGPRSRAERMRTASIQTTFKRAAARAGVHLTPHTLRRGWYNEYMAHGGDNVSAMNIAGWTREVMPYRYGADRRDDTSQVVFDEVAARQVTARRRRPLRAVN